MNSGNTGICKRMSAFLCHESRKLAIGGSLGTHCVGCCAESMTLYYIAEYKRTPTIEN